MTSLPNYGTRALRWLVWQLIYVILNWRLKYLALVQRASVIITAYEIGRPKGFKAYSTK